jgi:excisionase family DNA binding protein
MSKRGHVSCATISLAEFAVLLGLSYTTAHQAAQAGTLPVKPIRVGRQYRFPKAKVLELLGISEVTSELQSAA